jgi:monofunctional glycosyltransferase
MAVNSNATLPRIVKLLKRAIIFLVLLHFIYLLLLKWINPPFTITQLSSVFSGQGLQRDYVTSGDMSMYTKLAVIAAEDQLFPLHDGFDWKSIEKAQAHNSKANGKPIKGASTISQQVAKNVFLWQGRSWFRKGLEVYFTFMIERIWGKHRILEMYLNVIEMGEGVYGIEAAAQKYFKKSAKSISRQEAAMIAACLPNPKKYTVRPLSPYILHRYPQVVKQMNNLKDDADIQKLLQ